MKGDAMADDEIADFTEPKPEHGPRFRIDDDLFECVPVLPGGVIRDIARIANMTNEAQRIEMVPDILDAAMTEGSAVRFAERLVDPKNPITMQQVGKVLQWMVVAYSGGRPTSQLPGGSAGPGGIGTSLTDGVLTEVPTP